MEVSERGKVARDFLLGYLKAGPGVVFRLSEGPTSSDGALKAIEEAKRSLFRPDWEKVFARQAIREGIRKIKTPAP